MRQLLLAALAMSAMCRAGPAADVPNFSGEWKMTPDRLAAIFQPLK